MFNKLVHIKLNVSILPTQSVCSSTVAYEGVTQWQYTTSFNLQLSTAVNQVKQTIERGED